jgi:hypothetical protein
MKLEVGDLVRVSVYVNDIVQLISEGHNDVAFIEAWKHFKLPRAKPFHFHAVVVEIHAVVVDFSKTNENYIHVLTEMGSIIAVHRVWIDEPEWKSGHEENE